jgi:hypothetical protein
VTPAAAVAGVGGNPSLSPLATRVTPAPGSGSEAQPISVSSGPGESGGGGGLFGGGGG